MINIKWFKSYENHEIYNICTGFGESKEASHNHYSLWPILKGLTVVPNVESLLNIINSIQMLKKYTMMLGEKLYITDCEAIVDLFMSIKIVTPMYKITQLALCLVFFHCYNDGVSHDYTLHTQNN